MSTNIDSLRIWYMRDNHTFKELPLDVDAALELIRQEYDNGEGYGMLCSKQFDEHVHCGKDFSVDLPAIRAWLDAAIAASKPEPQAQAEPCPNSRSDEFACKNRHQCWEPCGELGHSEEHASPASAETTRTIDEALGLPQAQAGEPANEKIDERYPYTYAADYIRMRVGNDYGKGLISRAAASCVLSIVAEAIGHKDHHEIACAIADIANREAL